MNFFKKNKEEKSTKNKKQYRVLSAYNIWTGEVEKLNMVTDEKGLSNLVVNGFEDLKIEEI